MISLTFEKKIEIEALWLLTNKLARLTMPLTIFLTETAQAVRRWMHAEETEADKRAFPQMPEAPAKLYHHRQGDVCTLV